VSSATRKTSSTALRRRGRQDNILGPATWADMEEDCFAGQDGRTDSTECAVDAPQVSGMAKLDGLYGAATRGLDINLAPFEYLLDATVPWGELLPLEAHIRSGVPVHDEAHGWKYWERPDYIQGWRHINELRRAEYQKTLDECQAKANSDAAICNVHARKTAGKIRPRPAMGWNGPEAKHDRFLNSMLGKKLFPVDQSKWLFDHSGMRIPTSALFQKVYQEVVWERFLKKTGFGRYA